MNNTEIIREFEFYLVNEKRRTNNTLYNYLRDLEQFLDFIKNKNLQEVTPKDIKMYIMNLVSVERVSAATQNRKIATLRTFFGRFMVRENLIEVSPTALVDSAEVPESIPEPIELSDIEKMIAVTTSLRDKLLLELLYATGARRFELAKMKFSDINLASKQVKIIGKKNKTRFVPLHGLAIEMISQWREQNPNDYIFPGRDGKSPLSTRSVNHIVNSIKEKAGLSGKNITPHKFRHSFCSHLYESGADILTIKDLAGHSKTDTTLVYTKTSTKRNRAEYEQYHPRAQQVLQQAQKQESLQV
ncbi:tyrosine-type recombinase/integrase [Solibacillus silvestris]